MKVSELLAELRNFPPDAEVHLYAGKCCDVQPINHIQFQPKDHAGAAMVVLVDETQQICIAGKCNCE